MLCRIIVDEYKFCAYFLARVSGNFHFIPCYLPLFPFDLFGLNLEFEPTTGRELFLSVLANFLNFECNNYCKNPQNFNIDSFTWQNSFGILFLVYRKCGGMLLNLVPSFVFAFVLFFTKQQQNYGDSAPLNKKIVICILELCNRDFDELRRCESLYNTSIFYFLQGCSSKY